MSAPDVSPPTLIAPPPSFRSALRAIISHRGVRFGAAFWLAAYAVVLWLAHGRLPFDRPAVARVPFALQMAVPTVVLAEILALVALVFLVTRQRIIPDMAARAPERRLALRETIYLLAYAAVGQVGGWIVASALGVRPFSFHIAGTVFDCTVPPTPTEVWLWATYNFLVFAVAPYLCFRRRYSNTALNLRSADRKNDTLVIFMVLAIESAFELTLLDKSIFGLSPRQALLGAPLSFMIFFFGTVLPTMVLIYAILLPRYLKLTGSPITAALLGGLTYAAMHIVEGWSAFDSPRNSVLSLIFVMFGYFGPGMFKSVLTLRTGNAWVHAISYHAIAPHVIVDTPLVVKVFGIR
jgi:hypothetical protein